MKTGDMQSLVQLGVALNVGFSAILAYSAGAYQREARRLDQLKFAIEYYKNNMLQDGGVGSELSNPNFFETLLVRWSQVRKNLDDAQKGSQDNLHDKLLRPAVFVSVFGIILLVYSTFFSDDAAPMWFVLLAILTVAFFPLAVFYSYIKSRAFLTKLRAEISELDDKVCRFSEVK